VKSVNVNTGKFVSPTDALFELVNTDDIHLALNVYEKDISSVQPGQKIIFTLPNKDSVPHEGKVILVSKSINADKTVTVHAHIDKDMPSLLFGMYVKAQILTGSKSVTALPEQAVLNADGKDLVFIQLSSNKYKMLEVQRGYNSEGFTQITLPEGLEKAQFVTKGAYLLLSKLKSEEE